MDAPRPSTRSPVDGHAGRLCLLAVVNMWPQQAHATLCWDGCSGVLWVGLGAGWLGPVLTQSVPCGDVELFSAAAGALVFPLAVSEGLVFLTSPAWSGCILFIMVT